MSTICSFKNETEDVPRNSTILIWQFAKAVAGELYENSGPKIRIVMHIRRIFVDSNILWSKIYKSHECSGALVEALMKYDGEFKFESLETKGICRTVNI